MNARSMRLPIIAATALALSASAASFAEAADREAIAGMVRRTEIRIAPETSGRLASVAVKPGQKVRKGDIIAVLDNPDLSALVGKARAAAASAKAERDRIYSGVRREQVDIAVEAVRTAEANLVLAQQENDRATALAAKNFASRQTADEAAASLAKGEADLEVKRARQKQRMRGLLLKSGRSRMPGSRLPRRRWPVFKPSSTRQGSLRQPMARSTSASPNLGRSSGRENLS